MSRHAALLCAALMFAALGMLAGPAVAQPAPAAPPAQATPAKPSDPFGETVTLTEKTVVIMKGHANWDSAFETLVDRFKLLNQYLDKQNIVPNGLAMTVYTKTDDTGFDFEAALPIPDAPKDAPKGDISISKSPGGKALKFVHRGSYDTLDSTYEAITNYLDEKRLDARDLFIEEYSTDPVKTAEDKLVVNVYVPIK